MNEQNPVVILVGEVWHIAENGRSAKTTHCGQTVRQQRAHSRFRTVGLEHVCPKCVRLYRQDFPDAFPTLPD